MSPNLYHVSPYPFNFAIVTHKLLGRVTMKMDFDYSIEYRYSWYQEYLIFYLILIVSRIVRL